MRTMLALLVLGVSIALSGATAFAESERGGADHDVQYQKYQAPLAVVQTDPVDLGTFAGGSAPSIPDPRGDHEYRDR